MPILEMVAGDAELRSCVSNRKLTLGPNWILSPEGMVRRRLSSSTELRDSTHSGSMSPSLTIQDWTSGTPTNVNVVGQRRSSFPLCHPSPALHQSLNHISSLTVATKAVAAVSFVRKRQQDRQTRQTVEQQTKGHTDIQVGRQTNR